MNERMNCVSSVIMVRTEEGKGARRAVGVGVGLRKSVGKVRGGGNFAKVIVTLEIHQGNWEGGAIYISF